MDHHPLTTVHIKERPILFSGPMVQAILEGRKTQTRRIVKREFMHQSDGPRNGKWYIRRADAIWDSFETIDELAAKHCPYGKIGDRLWVRETMKEDGEGIWRYTADNEAVGCDRADESAMIVCAHHKTTKHTSSIHMPRWASRISLQITDVRVERLQNISEQDAEAEGIECFDPDHDASICRVPGVTDWDFWNARSAFEHLWKKINGAESWDANPWVWAVSFKVVR